MQLRHFSALALLLSLAGPAEAASLRVAPVGLDIPAPGASATIRVWNDAKGPINVQVRVFRWEQDNGAERLVPTRDVVVSPPITRLEGGGENIVRVVRVRKQPITAEESYRVVVDELPDPSGSPSATIRLIVRHSIPVFFGGDSKGERAALWSVRSQNGGYLVTVRNTSTRHFKISNLTLSGAGKPVAVRSGLVGYALAGATMSWFIPGVAMGTPAAEPLTVTAESETGPVDAVASFLGG